MKELFAATGESLTVDDTKRAVERAWQRTIAEAGEPSADERSFYQKRVIPLILQTASSAVPAVPAVVRPRLYEIIDALLPELAEKIRIRFPETTDGQYTEAANRIRRVRHDWENECRPAAYVEVARRLESVLQSLGNAA